MLGVLTRYSCTDVPGHVSTYSLVKTVNLKTLLFQTRHGLILDNQETSKATKYYRCLLVQFSISVEIIASLPLWI